MAKREAWIYRAAAATACCLLLWFAFTVGWMWAYRQIVKIAPEWWLQSTRGSSTILGYALIAIPDAHSVLSARSQPEASLQTLTVRHPRA